MAKPLSIKPQQICIHVNGMPVRRIQTFDFNSAIDLDTIYEIGNASRVEESINNVNTPITMTSNEWGTVDLEALIFEKAKIEYANSGSATGVKIFTAGTIASVGDWLHVMRSTGTIRGDYVEIKAIVALAAGSLRYQTTGTHCFSSAPKAGDVVMLCNKYTITEDDLDNKYCDFVLPIQQKAGATLIDHSIILPRAAVNSLTYTFDTGGAADISFGLIAEEERICLGSMREIVSCVASFMSYTAGGTVIAKVPRNNIFRTNGYRYYAYANEVGATPSMEDTGTILIDVGTGKGFVGTDRYSFFFAKDSVVGYRGLENVTDLIGKLKKGNIVVGIATGENTTSQLLRCQSVTITPALDKTELTELGNDKVYGRSFTNPFRLEIALSFNKNDLREYAYMTNQVAEFDAGTLTEILMTDLKESKDTKIDIKLYNSRTLHEAANLLKTFTFTGCNFIGDTTRVPVTGISGLDLSFSSGNITITGSGVAPIYP